MNIKTAKNLFSTNKSNQLTKKSLIKNSIFKKAGIIKTFLFLMALAFSASAATYTVTTTADNPGVTCLPGDCSLRQAVNAANLSIGGDTINFQGGLTGVITLTGGDLDIATTSVTINGPGARVLTVSGNNLDRVFTVSGVGNTVNISGLTITGGAALIDGGGILNTNGSTLNLTEVNVTGNHAVGMGGGVATSALLLVVTTTNITRSLINGNTAVAGGGGVSNLGTDLVSGAFVTMTNTTVTNNNSGVAAAGIMNTGGTMNLVNNTISHNHALAIGGGIVNVTGGLLGAVNLRNNIIAQNDSLVGTDLISSDGLGVFNSLGNNLIGNNLNIDVYFSASIVVGGILQPNINADLVGSVSLSYNLADPQLGPLQNNGGPTDTRFLRNSSPALEGGNNCVLTGSCPTNNVPALTVDQRGTGFGRQSDGNADTVLTADIGAFESQGVPAGSTFTVTNLNDTTPNGCTVADCTLREAILDSDKTPGADTINFAGGLNGTIALSPVLGQLVIPSDMTINGPGARIVSVSGENNNRVFLVQGMGTDATIKGLTITKGNALLLGTLLGDGGGVLNIGGANLRLIDDNISGNNAVSFGGGVATRSLLGTTSWTYILRTLVSNNHAILDGGGVSNIATANILSSATTTVVNSTVSTNSTVAAAGGVSNLGGTVDLISDTITENTSVVVGGGVVNVLGALGLGVTHVRNTIIAKNNAAIVGGILTFSDDVFGFFDSLGHNLVGSNVNAEVSFQASVFVGVTPTPNVNGDIVGSITIGSRIDPKLGPLQNNGGQSDTHAPSQFSPAMNQGNNCVELDNCSTDPSPNTLPDALAYDQRGVGFQRRQNSAVEIGSYEQPLALTAARVNVSGRVTDAKGRPIMRITVTMTNMSGVTRTVTTNTFGNFLFRDVQSGGTYIIEPVSSKRYIFSSQVVGVMDEIAGLSFIGEDR